MSPHDRASVPGKGAFDDRGEHEAALQDMLSGASVLVTGGTGSFGKMFIRTVLQSYEPDRLIVFSRDELKQFEMQQDPDFRDRPNMRYFIGDVRDADRLEMAFRGVDYVVHAAALKQVPAAEYNPFECIRTNVHGAENVINASIRQRVKRIIALSTAKAVNPINLYGASKLAADKIFVAANHLSGTPEKPIAIVRYGNVIGSRASVIPFFQNLIAQGADSLPITDERMTRFWITLQQGVNFVLTSLASARGGEIFVPKIPSMRVVDLAKALAPELATHIVGIRPGEKIHESLITVDDARTTLELADRYVITPAFAWWSHKPYTENGALTVPDGFSYTSDNNAHWIDPAGLRDLIGSLRPAGR